MSTRVGIGFSDMAFARDAAIEASRVAADKLGDDRCDVLLTYASARHHPVMLHSGIRELFGKAARIVGCQTAGVITNDHARYNGPYIRTAAIRSDAFTVEPFLEDGLETVEFETGVRRGRKIAKQGAASGALVLTYDSMRRADAGHRAYASTPLLDGIASSLSDWPMTIGDGQMGDLDFSPSAQWADERVGFGTAWRYASRVG